MENSKEEKKEKEIEEKKEEEKNIIKENPIPPGFIPVKEEDMKKEDCIFEVYKSENYSKIIPPLIQNINLKKYFNKTSEDYPYFSSSNAVKFLPKLDTPSEILSNNQLKELHLFFPYFHQYSSLYKIFTISKDGTELKSLYKKCEGIKNSIIVIKDKEQNIFGAFASDIIYPSFTFTGTADSFLFTFYKEEKIHIYKATEINDNYMYCDNEQICFGSDGEQFSLALKNNLLDGFTKTTDTYKNKPLNGSDKFTIAMLEIWGFKEQ